MSPVPAQGARRTLRPSRGDVSLRSSIMPDERSPRVRSPRVVAKTGRAPEQYGPEW